MRGANIETIAYTRSSPGVGDMECQHCGMLTPAWRFSGMSQLCPHFYCDRCSNVIQQQKDAELVHVQATPEHLETIARDLPGCPCGGRFRPGCNAKCAHCSREFKHHWDPVVRLGDPYMIVVDGACVFQEDRPPYRVWIVDG